MVVVPRRENLNIAELLRGFASAVAEYDFLPEAEQERDEADALASNQGPSCHPLRTFASPAPYASPARARYPAMMTIALRSESVPPECAARD